MAVVVSLQKVCEGWAWVESAVCVRMAGAYSGISSSHISHYSVDMCVSISASPCASCSAVCLKAACFIMSQAYLCQGLDRTLSSGCRQAVDLQLYHLLTYSYPLCGRRLLFSVFLAVLLLLHMLSFSLCRVVVVQRWRSSTCGFDSQILTDLWICNRQIWLTCTSPNLPLVR